MAITLSSDLNSRIAALAPKFTASDIAPSNFQALKSQGVASLIVWSGASDNTIYGDASVNHAMRAWHDSLHLSLNADFTLQGELRVALEQARLVKNDALAEIIIAEVYGQALFFDKHGEFPVNQVEFIINYLKGIDLSLKHV